MSLKKNNKVTEKQILLGIIGTFYVNLLDNSKHNNRLLSSSKYNVLINFLIYK